MTSFLFFAALLAADPVVPPGKLVVVGGGSTGPAITQKTLELAGGKAVRMLIVPQSSARPEAGSESAAHWREAGAGQVEVLDLTDLGKAVAAIQSADLIWIPGGDQNRLMKSLAGTGVIEAIRKRHAEGATVGGTSAGAAVMSAVMITGDADLKFIKAGETKTADGLGLWPGVIVDQHFVRRQRVNRLIGAVLDHPRLVGVGIDEGTAAVVHGSKFEVIGAGQVVVIDARKATVELKDGQPAAATGLRVHVLRPGMSFDLR